MCRDAVSCLRGKVKLDREEPFGRHQKGKSRLAPRGWNRQEDTRFLCATGEGECGERPYTNENGGNDACVEERAVVAVVDDEEDCLDGGEGALCQKRRGDERGNSLVRSLPSSGRPQSYTRNRHFPHRQQPLPGTLRPIFLIRLRPRLRSLSPASLCTSVCLHLPYLDCSLLVLQPGWGQCAACQQTAPAVAPALNCLPTRDLRHPGTASKFGTRAT